MGNAFSISFQELKIYSVIFDSSIVLVSIVFVHLILTGVRETAH